MRPHRASLPEDIYKKFKDPFLSGIPEAKSKQLLIRGADVQVIHGFNTAENARGYLTSRLFDSEVVVALKPLLGGDPEVRIYEGLD